MSARMLVVPVLLAALGLCVFAPFAVAGEGEERIVQRIKILVEEAKALQDAGQVEAAKMLMKRAHAMKAKLAGPRAAGERPPMTLEQAQKVLQALNHGMEALALLRRGEELEAVKRVALELKAKLEAHQKAGKAAKRAKDAKREKDAKRAKEAKRGKDAKRDKDAKRPHVHRERASAKKRIEALRLAMKAFHQVERHEEMKKTERAIHALEFVLEGRNDAEARKARKAAPQVGEEARLLVHAANLWREWGYGEYANGLMGLAEHMSEVAAMQRRAAADRQKEAKTQKRRGPPKSDRAEGRDVPREHAHANKALEKMERRLAQIQKMVEALRKEMKAFRTALNR